MGVDELRALPAIAVHLLHFLDSIREERHRHIDLPHAGMQAFERPRVLDRSDAYRRLPGAALRVSTT